MLLDAQWFLIDIHWEKVNTFGMQKFRPLRENQFSTSRLKHHGKVLDHQADLCEI